MQRIDFVAAGVDKVGQCAGQQRRPVARQRLCGNRVAQRSEGIEKTAEAAQCECGRAFRAAGRQPAVKGLGTV
jgi:hypothetical protein